MFFHPVAACSDMDPSWVADHWTKLPFVILPDGNIRGGPSRLSFPWLFTKQPAIEEGNEPKHAASFLFPAGADLSLPKREAGATAVAKWANAGQPGGPALTTPFKDQGDKSYEGYVAGSTFITCTSEQRPILVDVRGAPIIDPEKFYPGCWVLPIIRPFAYDRKVKKGVSFGLQGCIWIADDRRLGGGGVDVNAAVAGINITGDVNHAALFNGSGGAAAAQVNPASLF